MSEALCRFAGHTCGGCCWGERLSQRRLRVALAAHTRLARSWRSGRPPARWRLLLHELQARRGLDLLWLILLAIPLLGDWLRPRLKRRLVCAFLAFEDDAEQRIGCLLHPARWPGWDVRSQAAFALLPGVTCGRPDYLCQAALWFARAPWPRRQRLAEQTAGQDWFAYSRSAMTFRPDPQAQAPPLGNVLRKNARA